MASKRGGSYMEKKGLCITCVKNKGCSFGRKFPVLYCEEFDNYLPKSGKMVYNKRKK